MTAIDRKDTPFTSENLSSVLPGYIELRYPHKDDVRVQVYDGSDPINVNVFVKNAMYHSRNALYELIDIANMTASPLIVHVDKDNPDRESINNLLEDIGFLDTQGSAYYKAPEVGEIHYSNYDDCHMRYDSEAGCSPKNAFDMSEGYGRLYFATEKGRDARNAVDPEKLEKAQINQKATDDFEDVLLKTNLGLGIPTFSQLKKGEQDFLIGATGSDIFSGVAHTVIMNNQVRDYSREL